MSAFSLSGRNLLCLWLLLMSLVGFCAMGLDKHKARRKTWRIPEKHLFLWALLGGCPGCILGMRVFCHKTRVRSFRWGLPTLFFFQLALGALLWQSGFLE